MLKRLTLTALVVVLSAAAADAAVTITAARRVVETAVAGNDPRSDAPPTDADRTASSAFGEFDESADASAGGAYASAGQFSEIDTDSNYFEADGSAGAGLYVQGSGDSFSRSLFRFDFTLTGEGTLELNGSLGVTNVESRDRNGAARAVLRVIDRDSGTNVVRRVITANNLGAFSSGRISVDQSVDLTSGRYRVLIFARAEDESAFDEVVEGSNTEAFYEVRGIITE